MVGKGVLLECLLHPAVETVTLVNRSPIDIQHPKMKEILLSDFLRIDSVKDQLGIPDACFHCMGVSSVGMDEEAYTRLTFGVTRTLGDVCVELNPSMTFIYVSGTGTDQTEQGRIMWARVKGKTENYLRSLGFYKCLLFRPGFIVPENGIESRTELYNKFFRVLRPLFPLFKRINRITTTTRIGAGMLRAHFEPDAEQMYYYNPEINALAK